MKIFFEGFYGFKNAGDDAFVEVSSWGAEKYWKCNDNFFSGASLPETIHKIKTPNIKINAPGFDRITLLKNLKNTDYFISSGGSTFSKLPIHSNKSLASYYKLINNNLKLGAIGVSIGPFKNSQEEKKVIKYLKGLSFLSLRDKRSYEYSKTLNLNYDPVKAFDLAALLPSVFKSSNSILNESFTEKKSIGISICNCESYYGGDLKKEINRNSYFKELVNLIITKTNAHLKVFIINGNSKIGDLKISNELMDGISQERFSIIPYFGNVEKTWDAISKCNLMISTRLHASIFACYANVPFILIEYHKKCSDFLNDIGQQEEYRVYDADVSPKETLNTVINILKNNYNKPTHLLETIALSKKNFTDTLLK